MRRAPRPLALSRTPRTEALVAVYVAVVWRPLPSHSRGPVFGSVPEVFRLLGFATNDERSRFDNKVNAGSVATCARDPLGTLRHGVFVCVVESLSARATGGCRCAHPSRHRVRLGSGLSISGVRLFRP